jgi:WD40 repeat protein/serine/threonine protein kinase/tetratricopeptide (TPR) repeat protein
MSDSGAEQQLLNDLAEEFAERQRRGERPTLGEYTDRYPQLAGQIRELFPALVMLERVRPDTADATRAYDGPPAGEGARLERLGDYRILREVGRGGMGIVYEAEQISLGRRVALKVLPAAALLDPKHLRRFEREARAAARLHHTNIVPVYGVGEDSGVHYYVMQFIPGRALDEVLAELKRQRSDPPLARSASEGALLTPSPAEGPPAPSAGSALSETGRGYWQSVARVGIQVGEALAYAAGQGILHRDVKPANLLLDGQGTVWVTDFGLAKAVADTDNLTHTGDVVGTLRYLAPERFRGPGDARSDVYALGLTLYELLTLRQAFPETDRNRLVEQVTRAAPPPPRRLNPEVPRDLETIVLKAIDRDPDRRYPSAAALADDLRRFVEDRPIRARRVSARERLWRWCRRNPVVAGLTALAALLLVGVAGVSMFAALRIDAARVDAVTARGEAEKSAELSRQQLVRAQVASGAALVDQGDLHGALPWFAEALRHDGDDPARAENHRLRLAAAVGRAPRLVGLWNAGEASGHAVFCPDGQRILVANTPPRGTGFLWPARGKGVLWTADVATGRRLVTITLADTLLDFALSPDGKRVATASQDGTAQVWDLETGRPVGDPLRHRGPVHSVAYRPDGRQLVTTDDRTARVWDADTGRAVQVIRPQVLLSQGPVLSAVFSPDGERVATNLDGWARVWRVAGGRPLTPPVQIEGGAWRDVEMAFSADGRRLLVGGGFRVIRTWDADTGRSLHQSPPAATGVALVRFSPDRKRAVSFSGWNPAQLWDVDSAEPLTPPLRRFHQTWAAAFNPQGDAVATGGVSGVVHVWQTATLDLVAAPLRHGPLVTSVEFSPDGRQVVTRDADGIVRVWDLAGGAAPASALVSNEHPVAWRQARIVVFSPRANRMVTDFDFLRLWDTRTGRLVADLQSLTGRSILTKAFSADGRQLVTGSTDGTARVWDAATGRPVSGWVRHAGLVAHASFSPDGRLVVTSGQDKVALVWDAETTRQVAELPHGRAVRCAAFSPDGRRVVTGTGDFADYMDLIAPRSDPDRKGEVRVWDAATGRPITPPLGTAGAVQQVAFSPGGGRVLAVTAGGPASRDRVRVWDAATGRPVGEPVVHPQGLLDAAFSPDGRRVATAGADGGLRLWDVEGGSVLGSSGHADAVMHLTFSPDGRRLLTASQDGTARLWDADSGQPVAVFPHASPVLQATFAEDGHSVVTGCADGAVRTWRLAPDDRPADDWAAVARVLNAGQADPGGGAPVSLADLEQTWQDLRKRYPHDFGTSPQEQTAWHRAAALKALRKKAWAEAARQLGRLVQIDPTSWQDRLTRARVLARLEQWDEAQAEFTRAVEGRADVADTRLARGSFLLARGQRDLAAADFRKALDLQPNLPAAMSEFWVAGPYGSEDLPKAFPPEAQTDPARPIPPVPGEKESLSRWRGEVPDPSGLLDLAVCFDSAEHISAYALAYAWSKAEQEVVLLTGSDDSMRLWVNGERLFEFGTGRPPRPDEDRIPAHLRAGWNVILVKVVNYTGRHGLYLRLSGNPADLAAAYLGRGKPDQALAALDARLALERGRPGEAAVLFQRAFLHARLRHWKEAAADYDRGLALDPGDHEQWYMSGFLCLQVGDPDGYRRHCRELLRRFGDTQDPMIAERTAKLCLLRPEAGGDLGPALRLADRAVDGTERNTIYPHYQAVKGFADCRAGRYEQSLDWLKKAEEHLSHPIFKAEALLYQSLALHALHRGDEARQVLDRARSVLDGEAGTQGDLDGLWFDWIMAQVLRRDAEGLK